VNANVHAIPCRRSDRHTAPLWTPARSEDVVVLRRG
jgi:hypothetical protein